MSVSKFSWAFVIASMYHVLANAASICPTLSSSLNVDQAVNYALCHNPDTQQQWQQLRYQQAAVTISQANNYPTLSLQGSSNYSHSAGQNNNSLGLQARLSYILFDFGQRAAQQQQANALLQQAQWNKDSQIAELSTQVIQAYLNVLKAQSQIQVYQDSIKTNQQSLTRAEARFNTGVGTPLDVLQAKSALAQAQLSLVKAHSEVASQRGLLAQLLGVIPTQLPSLITIKTPENTALFSEAELESWLKTAISQRSEIKATKANLQAAEQAIISAKTALKPTVSVSANSNWQQNDSQATNSYGLGISVDVPFDLSGATQAKIQQSEIQKQQQETALQRSEQQIYSQVWQAFYQLQAALQTVDAAQQGIDSSQKAAQMASARYQVGLSTLLDVLTAQNQFTSQQQQLVAAQYDALIARNQLNYVLGQPINLLNTQ